MTFSDKHPKSTPVGKEQQAPAPGGQQQPNVAGSSDSGLGTKRRRRRRKKPGERSGTPDNAPLPPRAPESSAARSTAGSAPRARVAARPEQAPRENRRRPKRGRGPRPDPTPSPVQLVKSATTETAERVAVETPLSPDEVTELKRTFRFLHEHRKVLKLKLNAQEDLLLNGAREPEHRGVCQHLVAKLEYSRLVAAAERLEPKQRVRLVEGVLQFSTELSYLLLYLEALKEAGHAGANHALSQALRRIDFTRVTEGQMRRVLDLLVESFPPGDRPRMMLGLLESRSFREAFDSALTKLPQELSDIVGPLRVAHQVILHGRGAGPGDSLVSGVRMLLECGLSVLEPYKSAARARLLDLAIEQIGSGQLPASVHQQKDVRATLRELVDDFASAPNEHVEWQWRLCCAWIAAGEDSAAEKGLDRLTKQRPNHTGAVRALQALRAPRVARIALVRGKGFLPTKTSCPLKSGYCLDTQRELWVRVSELGQDTTAFDAQVRSRAQLQLPSVVPMYQQGTDDNGRRYVAYPRLGRTLKSRSVISAQQSFEILSLVASLAQSGVVLADLDLARFEMDESGARVWLLETWDSKPCAAEVAREQA
ncbi:MAG: hypothetical protein RJA70_1687, partial [Pseudomonadota bacterium]